MSSTCSTVLFDFRGFGFCWSTNIRLLIVPNRRMFLQISTVAVGLRSPAQPSMEILEKQYFAFDYEHASISVIRKFPFLAGLPSCRSLRYIFARCTLLVAHPRSELTTDAAIYMTLLLPYVLRHEESLVVSPLERNISLVVPTILLCYIYCVIC